jgi:hypothetical protein
MRPFLLAALLLVPLPLALAQGKKEKPKDRAKVLFALPFGAAPGKSSKLTLRGLKLDGVKEVKVAKGSARLLKAGKAAVPAQQDAKRVGDSTAEVELTLPADIDGEHAEITLTHADGDATHKLLIDKTPPVAEKEPNDGFKQAQRVTVGQTVEGAISRGQDVDVYRFETKGETVVVEVLAQRLGSALDSFLTVYDGGGQVVASSDDIEGSTDSRLELKLKEGAYYASVSDAHDQGGPAHPYRLVVRSK